MEIKIYSEKAPDRRQVFIALDDENEIESVAKGTGFVSFDKGVQFYLEAYIANQLDKFHITFNNSPMPSFALKDGETINVPQEKTEEEKEIEELEKRLEELKNK